jgi:hypothetical protein
MLARQPDSHAVQYDRDMTDQPYTEGVDAILEDVIRYARMSIEELRPLLKEVALNHLKDARGQMRLAGRPALRRLQALTERTLQASPYSRRLDLDRTAGLVRERFGQTFLGVDFSNFSEPELKTLFEGWVEEAAEDCRGRVHIIPCDLALDGVERIIFGPVVLHSRKAFWPIFETELEAYRQEMNEDGRQFGDLATTSAREYLGTFRDIAEVDVPGCDDPTSQTAATAALQAVLDFLHVLAGAGYTARMRGAGPAVGSDRRAAVTRIDGRLRIKSSSRMAGAHIGETGWRQLTGPDGERWLAPLAGTLWALVERRDLPLFADRFIDATAWYGDAAREPSPAAAAVKFVTAIERLLWTGETGRGVTRRVSERLAALCFSTNTWNFAEVEAEVRGAYDLRSALLHGRISKSDPDVGRRLKLCERHARALLLTWWDRFGSLFQTEISQEQLRDHLDKFTEDAREAARLGRASE